MRRVLATITNSPYSFGGVSTWLERITERLPAQDWCVTTVTHALDEQHLADWQGKHPGLALNPLLGKFARLDQIEPALENYLDREKPEVVLINGSYWMLPVLQRRKQKGERLRVIGVCHADENGYYSGLSFYRDCFDHVIGVSETCYQKLLALGFAPERTSLLPYGVPCPASLPVRAEDGALRLAYVGRLEQGQKRILDFIPLVAALYARHIDFRLDFYGSGVDEPVLRSGIEAIDSEQRVHFHGWLPANQVATTAWQNADIFLLLSAYEGLAISMIEAMANGIVPIVSRVESGVAQVIREGETGYTFPIGDIETCAQQIASLARDRQKLQTTSMRAWSLIRQEYSLERHVERLAGILNAVTSTPPQLAPARYMGLTSHPLVHLIPPMAFVLARRLAKRGNPLNQGYAYYQ